MGDRPVSDDADLAWEDWHMLTGLPREAFDEWLLEGPEVRREIVDMFQTPEDMDTIRKERT